MVWGASPYKNKEMNVRNISSPSMRNSSKFSCDRLADAEQLLFRDDFRTNYHNTTGTLPPSLGQAGYRCLETEIIPGIDEEGVSDGVCSVKRIVDCLPRTAVL